MATVFWDRKVFLLVKFMQQGTTVNAASYCSTLNKLRLTIEQVTWSSDSWSSEDWLSSQAADIYDLGIQKLVEHYDKRLNKYENHVEK